MNDPLQAGTQADVAAATLESKVIAWRRDIHEHPELSNREDAHLEASWRNIWLRSD